jgi:hypothetical protein
MTVIEEELHLFYIYIIQHMFNINVKKKKSLFSRYTMCHYNITFQNICILFCRYVHDMLLLEYQLKKSECLLAI